MENSKFNEWFDTFIYEKGILFSLYTIEHNGENHFIDSDAVIDLIKKASSDEQKTIKNMLVRIDFANACVHDYFKHLGKCYILTNYNKN